MPQPGEVGTPDTRQPRRAAELHALADAFATRAEAAEAAGNRSLAFHLRVRWAGMYQFATLVDRDGWPEVTR